LNNNPEIISLNLRKSGITHSGAVALAKTTAILTSLNLSRNSLCATAAMALASNQNITLSEGSMGSMGCIGDTGYNALNETNPLKRANLGRSVNRMTITSNRRYKKTEPLFPTNCIGVPSLLRLCLFKVQQSPQLDKSKLTIDLQRKLIKPKV
jgi:hypothetical protein